MLEPKHSIFHLGEILTIATALVGLIFTIGPHFQGPEVVYFTKEVTTYPVTYRDNKLVPADIQEEALVGGPVKILELVVRNDGDRSASNVLVRIKLLTGDASLGGWMSENNDPSTVHMLGLEAEHRFPELIPGDAVSFYLYLKNVNSGLAHRIGVFYGDGRPATYYQYIPVRYVGSDGVVIPLRKLWIYLFGLMLAVSLLLSVARMRKPKQLAISADRHSPADASEQVPTSSSGVTARDQMNQDPPPSHRTAGGR